MLAECSKRQIDAQNQAVPGPGPGSSRADGDARPDPGAWAPAAATRWACCHRDGDSVSSQDTRLVTLTLSHSVSESRSVRDRQ